MYAGSYAAGWVVKQYPPVTVVATAADGKQIEAAGLPSWAGKPDESMWRYLDLSATIHDMIYGPKQASVAGPDFAQATDTNQNGTLELAEIVDTWVELPAPDDPTKNITYTGESLREVFPKIDSDDDGSVTRAEWRTAQASAWQMIWIWPAMMAGVTCLIFWLGFHDRVAET